MEQTIRLAADVDGVLVGVEHTAVNNAGMVDTHVEPATEASKNLYAAPSIRTRQIVERVNLNVPTPMRAPVEGPGLWALESAMNELADTAGLDPLDLRWPTSPRCVRATAGHGRATGCGKPTWRVNDATAGGAATIGRASMDPG